MQSAVSAHSRYDIPTEASTPIDIEVRALKRVSSSLQIAVDKAVKASNPKAKLALEAQLLECNDVTATTVSLLLVFGHYSEPFLEIDGLFVVRAVGNQF